MPDISVRIEGLEELQRRISPSQFKAVLGRGLKAAAIHLEGEVKERTPVGKTGDLRAKTTHKGGGLRYEIGTDVKYARYVEEGTGLFGPRKRKYPIEPRNKKALAWPATGQTAAGLGRGPQGTSKRGGSLIVRKRVMHPGIKGVHMFERTAKEERSAVEGIVKAQLERALSGGI